MACNRKDPKKIHKPLTRYKTEMSSQGGAKQSFKEECDINNILAKYQETGAITHANNRHADYGFATSLDFHESMDLVLKAQEMFDELPSSIRAKFGHSPGAFLDFAQDPENAQEMADMGLSEPTQGTTQENEEKATRELDEAPTPQKAAESQEKTTET